MLDAEPNLEYRSSMQEPDPKNDFLRSGAFRECFVVFFVVGLIGLVVILPALANARKKASRINCVSNLKQVGIGLTIFVAENSGLFPMQISTNGSTSLAGGSKAWVGSTNVYRHFLAISNEIGSPKILACPVDKQRTFAQSFTNLANQHVSYWLELNARDKDPISLLTGDRNLATNGVFLNNGCYLIATQQTLAWDGKRLHGAAGNIGLSDCSVQQCNTTNLGRARLSQPFATNWLAIP